MSPHPLANFEIQKYFHDEPRSFGVVSINNFPKKIKDEAYVIKLDEYADVGTHWIALFCNRSETVCFDSFGVEHFPEEIKKFIEHKLSLTFLEYKHTIQYCAATFALDSLMLCLQVEVKN